MEFLELEKKLNGVNNGLDSTGEKISKLDSNRNYPKWSMKRKTGENEQSCSSKPVDNIRQPDWSLRRKGKRGEWENKFKELTAKHFSSLSAISSGVYLHISK